MASKRRSRLYCGRIEALAISSLRNAIDLYPNLQGHLKEADTTISLDGGITVYEGETWEKAACLGYIPVQVKGITRPMGKRGKSTYPVQVSDLRVFQRNMGVLYFVIEIDHKDQTTIYYAQLLPLDLERLLASIPKNQKTVSVGVRPLSYEPHLSLRYVCLNFLKERPKQVGRTPINPDLLDTLEEVKFQVTTERRSFIPFLLESDIYLYGRRSKSDEFSPVDKVQVTAIATPVSKPVTIRGQKYYDAFQLKRERDRVFILVGKGITFCVEDKTMHMTGRGSLVDRIRDLEFLLALIDAGSVHFGSHCWHFKEIRNLGELKRTTSTQLQRLKDAHSFLSLMGVTLDVDLNKSHQLRLKCLSYSPMQ